MEDQRSMYLRALDYPHADKFQVGDQAAYRTLVAWLEDTKIRFLPVDDRGAIRNVGGGKEWDEAYCKYLEELDCPVNLRKQSFKKPTAVDWLISQAVGFQYKDHAEELNKTAAAAAAAGGGGGGAKGSGGGGGGGRGGAGLAVSQSFSDVGSAAFREGVADLAKLLGIATDGASTVDLLKAVQATAVAAMEDAGDGGGKAPLTIKDFPLGFSVDGGKGVDKAAQVLRMLYVQDLRELQTAVDRAIVEVQEFTANPKTDAKLGRVGM